MVCAAFAFRCLSIAMERFAGCASARVRAADRTAKCCGRARGSGRFAHGVALGGCPQSQATARWRTVQLSRGEVIHPLAADLFQRTGWYADLPNSLADRPPQSLHPPGRESGPGCAAERGHRRRHGFVTPRSVTSPAMRFGSCHRSVSSLNGKSVRLPSPATARSVSLRRLRHRLACC